MKPGLSVMKAKFHRDRVIALDHFSNPVPNAFSARNKTVLEDKYPLVMFRQSLKDPGWTTATSGYFAAQKPVSYIPVCVTTPKCHTEPPINVHSKGRPNIPHQRVQKALQSWISNTAQQ